ncbi:uncharacterized protein LOC131223293 isoform X1 [Magnolia sinica]|uniref:uncharacterized protein LOC131223293 isoform X1 n=1 Tax=Magnolia sinica TaxID=86752 RepID=UPI00265B296B|nr:uncharacterized protein LOC131223293 isoform X1 [Magnolia sinica]XP_058074629.1 uncharacterized protein LOC131223293 isoform X1 [Magnolia sinica]
MEVDVFQLIQDYAKTWSMQVRDVNSLLVMYIKGHHIVELFICLMDFIELSMSFYFEVFHCRFWFLLRLIRDYSFLCLIGTSNIVFIGELWMVALHYHQHQDRKPLPDPQKCTRWILDQALREIAPLNMDCGTGRNSDDETSVNNVDMDGSQEVTTDAVNT